jgi:hypothetical protein
VALFEPVQDSPQVRSCWLICLILSDPGNIKQDLLRVHGVPGGDYKSEFCLAVELFPDPLHRQELAVSSRLRPVPARRVNPLARSA